MTDRKPEAGSRARKPGRPRLDAEMVPRILDAAERLFASREALHVSIRDIAAEAGVPHSAIYRYFDGKDDVLRQVLERGRDRQRVRDAESLRAGAPLPGAMEWLMTVNRAYARIVLRSALMGQTPTSLGVSPEDNAARQTARVLAENRGRFDLRTDHDPRAVAAAAAALALGWAAAEEWIVDVVGIGDRDIADVRREMDDIFGSMMALARDAREE